MLGRTFSWVGAGVLVVGGLAGLWLWYIYAQRLQLDEGNRRELAHAARNLGLIFSELTRTADSYFKQRSVENEKDVREFASRNPYIDAAASPEPGRCGNSSGKAALAAPHELILPSAGTGENKRKALKVTPEAIFDDVAISEAFEYLLIAAGDGKILFAMEHGAANRRREALGWLSRRADQEANRDHPVIRIHDLGGLHDSAGKPLKFDQLAASAGSLSVRLGETTYQLYYYPFEITSFKECAAAPATWVLGGLVDPDRVLREAVTVSPHWTLLFFLLLAGGLAAQPFLKLVMLSARERFRFSDFCLLIPSSTILLLLAAAALLDLGAYRRLTTLAGGGLEAIAAKIEDRLAAEIGAMRGEIENFERQLAPLADPFGGADITSLLSDAEKRLAPSGSARGMLQGFWVDGAGKQVFKAGVHEVGTGRVSVAHRPYFSEARSGHLWHFAGEDRGEPFLVQSLRSFTTGELSSVLSIRSKLAGKCSAGGPAVAVIEGHPLPFEFPLLPASYSFAVIGADGRVLYHSDRRRALKEDLLEEVSDPERLAAAMEARSARHFGTNYSRRRAGVFIRPFESVPEARWSIVVLRDKQWLDTANNEVLLRVMVWSLVPAGAPVALAILLFLGGKRTLRTIWPDPRKAALYRAAAVAAATVLFVGLAGATLLDGPWLFAWSLAFPWAGPALVAAVCLRGRAHEASPAAGGPSYRTWYIRAAAALWLTAAVVPAMGLFRYSWSLEMAKLDNFDQTRKQRLIDDWKARDRERWTQLKIANLQTFLDRRAGEIASYWIRLAEPANHTPLHRRVDDHIPFYTEATVSLRYRGPGGGPAAVRPPGPAIGYEDAEAAFPWTAWIGFASVALAIGWWLRYKDEYLFLSILPARLLPSVNSGSQPRLEIFVTPSQQDGRALASSLPQPALLLADFECVLLDQNRRLEALVKLEQTVAAGSSSAVILCHADPIRLLETAESEPPELRADIPAWERERWLRVLEPFTVYVTCVNETAEAEPFAAPRLREAYFESLWRYSSPSERLALVQVAQEGFANPRQAATIRHLVEKGLLVFRPNLELMSAAFERFVLGRVSPEQVRSWEKPRSAMGWRGSRWLLLLVLAVALLFILATQQSWIRSATLMLTGIASGLEALKELLGTIRRSRQALTE